MMHTVTDLLDYVHSEMGGINLVLRPLEITELVDAAIQQARIQYRDRGQRLAVQVDRGVTVINGDATRLVHVVQNLLSNAGKFSPPGGEIRVRISPARHAGFVQVSIQDQGPGLTDEDRRRLFERGFQGSAARYSLIRGAGLGLYIARQLVKLHGGDIWCEPDSGRGALFCMTLPVNQTVAEERSGKRGRPRKLNLPRYVTPVV
jgi:signal transduction histidine kinase